MDPVAHLRGRHRQPRRPAHDGPTRLCLDRLRARTPVPTEDIDTAAIVADPADDVVLADTVGVALQAGLDRLSPKERVAFVLHDSFGVEFSTIASILDTNPAAARQLASRSRAKVRQPQPQDALDDWQVVDAFMAAAREGEFARLLELLAPDAIVEGDATAVLIGTPARMAGQGEIAEFFNGSAHAALPVFVGGRAGYAWFHQGQAKVAFDFTVDESAVTRIDFRADPEILATVVRRRDQSVR
ncbi:hypothetical protein GCM10022199_16520 [Marihabitans asiaticum]|uniref:RNA polymerase ECF family sigma subunit n=1 Tax=Marihabitans asiaticum TaxID=415218 RepID=A0A560W7R2_9MICO|nr:RNA polymerase ECF family sigma subunit [Marihabitans asiaticum]